MVRFGERVFDAVLGAKKGEERNKLGLFLISAAAFVVGMLLVTLWARFGAENTDKYGQAGDFFGGILNPILSFLAFIGVLYSIHLQRNDLAENEKQTKKQFENAERQRFESTFFQMLSVHNSMVNSIDIIAGQGQFLSTGRESFKKYVKDLADQYNGQAGPMPDHDEPRIQEAYRLFWKEARKDLGHYMRFLYNTIRYVDDASLPMLEGDKIDPKTKYMRILRSQISDYELVIIFYNFFSRYGRNFRNYSAKYDLLDNLPREILLHPDHFKLRSGMGVVDGEHAI